MRSKILLTMTAVSVLCWLPHGAIAQDVMAKPSGNAPPSQESSSWFSIFAPSKGEAKPESKDAPKEDLTGGAGLGETAPEIPHGAAAAISKLPPEIQKDFFQKKKEPDALGHNGSIPNDFAARMQSKPNLPDFEASHLPPEFKDQYTQKREEVLELLNAERRAPEAVQTLEITMPELDKKQLRESHNYEHKLNVTLAKEAQFTSDDIKRISDHFGISPAEVAKSCEMRLHSVARSTQDTGYSDVGEEVKDGKALTLYDGDHPDVHFDVAARCKLSQPPEKVAIRIKERDKYLFIMGATDCKPSENAGRTPGSVSAEYLGDGKIDCAF